MSEITKTVVENPSNIYLLWAKIIRAKSYTKTVATQRVNIMYMVGQFTDEEYTSLIEIINEIFPN